MLLRESQQRLPASRLIALDGDLVTREERAFVSGAQSQSAGDPIHHDSGEFIDRMGGHLKGPVGREEVRDVEPIQPVSRPVSGFIATWNRCDAKVLCGKQGHGTWKMVGGCDEQD